LGYGNYRRPYASTKATAKKKLSPRQGRRETGDDFCDDFFRSPVGKGDEKWVWATILIVATAIFLVVFVIEHMTLISFILI